MKDRNMTATMVLVSVLTMACAADAAFAAGDMMGGSGGGMMGGSGGGMMGGQQGGMSGGGAGSMGGQMSKDGAESVRLKDGSMLYMNADGTMKMVDMHGNRMGMKDGETMETEDGRVIMMKNNALWERMRRGTLNPKFP